MYKKLKITYPPKTSNQFYTFPLAIIMSEPEMWSWYYSEFIQLFTFRDDNEKIMLRSYNYETGLLYPSLECFKPGLDKLKFGNDIITFYKLMIENDYYICIFGDNSYVGNLNSLYKNSDILLHGFDDAKEAFFVFGYKENELVEYEIPYKDFYEKYYRLICEDEVSETVFYYPCKNNKFNLNIDKIKWHLLDYIESVDTLRRERPYIYSPYTSCWGIKIYNELINMYNSHFKECKNIDRNDILCLYEHKKDFTRRIEYLSKHSQLKYTPDIFEKFKIIENNANTLLELIPESNKIIRSKECSDKLSKNIIGILNRMRDIELKTIKSYYEYNLDLFNNI